MPGATVPEDSARSELPAAADPVAGAARFVEDNDPSERSEPPAEPSEAPDGSGRPVGRRIVLGMVGLGLAGIAYGTRVQNKLAEILVPITEHDPTGLTDLLPSGGSFRYYSVTGSVPTPSSASYHLAVGGLVITPLSLSLDDLKALPQTTLVRDFQCVTGWRVPQVHWSGVRLSELLLRAGLRPGAAALRFRSFDGAYTESLTLDEAQRPDIIIALTMLGAPVTHDHGGPVRLYVAPMYGYKSIKWLAGIDVVDKVEPGYWEQYGYAVEGWVGSSNGRDDPTT